MKSGANIIDGGEQLNSEYCQVQTGNKIVKYTPDEVVEYGLKNGDIYIAKEIKISDSFKTVFLRRLIHDKTSLYYLNANNTTTFFVEKDSVTLIEIPKTSLENKELNYKDLLSEQTKDCEYVSSAIKRISFNEKSLSRFVKYYNNCNDNPFPFFKFGFVAGYEMNKLSIPKSLESGHLPRYNYKYEGAFHYGLFFDNPIKNHENYSFHTEIIFIKNSYTYSYYDLVTNSDINMSVKTSSVSIPLLARYSFVSKKITPFINLGLVYNYHYNNENTLNIVNLDEIPEIEAPVSDPSKAIPTSDTETVNVDDFIANPSSHVGYAIGGGIEIATKSRTSIFMELRYKKLYDFTDNETLNMNGLQLMFSFNL